jgi:hypothetical protein
VKLSSSAGKAALRTDHRIAKTTVRIAFQVFFVYSKKCLFISNFLRVEPACAAVSAIEISYRIYSFLVFWVTKFSSPFIDPLRDPGLLDTTDLT